ncbi:MAG TPA: AAA family ATPase [Opitutaceae bacterium]|nr:AAA family ATPase [Opitutaceae bacterium]
MPIYLINAHADAEKTVQLEQKIRGLLPEIIKTKNLENITQKISSGDNELAHVIFLAPGNDATYVDLLVRTAENYRQRVFFILVSDEISGSDYKRLVRSGGADWVSANAPAQEILDIIVQRPAGSEALVTRKAQPILVSFVPSAGGVGNSTLAIEVAIQLRRGKATANRRVCLVDLDFQTSHVCDYLDIEPRLHIEEISANPERLDNQLFEVFVSHHGSGVDVFASPRSKFDTCGLDFAALDGLFGLISTRYDLIMIDFPVNWYSWTPKIIAASSGIIVSGVNSIPGLRQIAEALTTLRVTTDLFGEIRVAINNCERGLFGQVARRQHVESVLPGEQIFYVRNDPAALESINTGMPMALSHPRRGISKDIAKMTAFCSGLTSVAVA